MSEQMSQYHDIMPLREAGPVPDRLDVSILHDDEISRRGLETLLRRIPGIGTVYVAETPLRACTALARCRPDIVLLPASLEPTVLQELLDTAHQVGAKVLLMLSMIDKERVRYASGLAADGFVFESGLNAESLTYAVEAVVRGEIPAPPSLMRELLSEVNAGGRRERDPQLTPREEAALALLVEGMSNKQIARRLGISENGAKRHVSNVLAKLNCPNRTIAAVVAVQEGLIAASAR